jgi:hypothetical protein
MKTRRVIVSAMVNADDRGSVPFNLAGGLAPEAPALFRRDRRLRIVEFLQPADALSLYRYLVDQVAWRSFVAADGRLFAPSASFRGSYPPELENQMREREWQGIQNGFAFWYDTDRVFPEDVPDSKELESARPAGLIANFAALLSSDAFLELARKLTGLPGIDRVEVQATRHRAHHFTGFNTRPQLKAGRAVAAFDLCLTPEWSVEWGGLRSFQGKDGYVVEAYAPSFNVLDIFALPQGHWISAVCPFVAAARLAISGRLYASC